MIGFGEVLIIGLIIILVFGSSQIPKLARSLGEGLKEFRKAVKDGKDGETVPGEETKKN